MAAGRVGQHPPLALLWHSSLLWAVKTKAPPLVSASLAQLLRASRPLEGLPLLPSGRVYLPLEGAQQAAPSHLAPLSPQRLADQEPHLVQQYPLSPLGPEPRWGAVSGCRPEDTTPARSSLAGRQPLPSCREAWPTKWAHSGIGCLQGWLGSPPDAVLSYSVA